ncbi:MAG: DUF5060 domain-containing protein [Armatimonadetes bacterium]|nr:DUF5060 domain-containing protein [Armatimonadota bacterium]
MSLRCFPLFAAALAALQPASAQRALTLAGDRDQVPRCDPLELRIGLDLSYANPYDPAQVDLRVELQGPGGRSVTLPAFCFQPYERRADWIYPAEPAGWRARFAPDQAGPWRAVAKLTDPAGDAVSPPLSFTCVPSNSHGYLRVARARPRYFELDDGTPFFAIGQDLCFIGPAQYVTLARAESIFEKLHQNGANYLRVWTCCGDWAMGIESTKSAWGRSWGPKPSIVTREGRRWVELAGEAGTAVAVDPPYRVALRPGTRYQLSGQVQAEGAATLVIEAGGAALGEPVAAGAQEFRRELAAGPNDRWLPPLRLRLGATGKVLVRGISLREAGTGPELLWEADLDRPARGVYNQLDCYLLDQLVESARRNGIYLQLCLLERDKYMGALKDPADPAYDRAIHDAKQLLRYAVARWGYATSVASWEFWNEEDPGLPTERFYAEAGEYLANLDPWHHLRATSAWGPAPKDWRHPQLDVADLHWYLRPNWNELWMDAAAAAHDRARFLLAQCPGKPALLSEFGLADEKWGLSPFMAQDKELAHHHDALWASAMSGLAGTAMFWWWERLDEQNGYRHYKPLADFVAGIPFNTLALRPITPPAGDPRVRVYGLQAPDRACLWLSSAEAAWHRVVVDKRVPPELESVSVELAELPDGDYRVVWWDTWEGKPTRQTTLRAAGGRLELAAPPFARDVACRVEPAAGR